MIQARPYVLLLSSLFFLVSCRTGGVILRDSPVGVSETRKAIVSVVGQPRHMSKDGRELTSNFFDRKQEPIENMDKARERLYTRVTIVGDRRPYDLYVEVLVEKRSRNGSFEPSGLDDPRAGQLAEKIRQALVQSRENRNVIDDFRSF